MNIEKGTKAKVFDPKKSEKRNNTITATISTKEGKTEQGNAIYSSWYTRFVGAAYEKACMLKGKEWIHIVSGKVENEYNKERAKLFVTVTIFDFDVVEKE